jgi:hypothetical protein
MGLGSPLRKVRGLFCGTNLDLGSNFQSFNPTWVLQSWRLSGPILRKFPQRDYGPTSGHFEEIRVIQTSVGINHLVEVEESYPKRKKPILAASLAAS